MARRVPYLIDQVNYAMTLTEDPCNGPPWIVQMELAQPAFGSAIITMLTFGWDDVARGYFRPRGLHRGTKARRGPRSTGRLHRLGRFLGRIPGLGDDTGDFIGKRLPGAKIVKGVRIDGVGKAFWLIDNKLQQALFWWLVIDVVDDFWYEWTSLLMASEVCHRAFEAAAYRTGTGGWASQLHGWLITMTDDTRWEEGGISMRTGKMVVPAGTWKVTAAGIWRNASTSAGYHGLRLVLADGSDRVLDEHISGVIIPGLVVHNVVMATVTGPVGVWVKHRSFFANFGGQELHDVVQGNSPGFVPPPMPPWERL